MSIHVSVEQQACDSVQATALLAFFLLLLHCCCCECTMCSKALLQQGLFMEVKDCDFAGVAVTMVI